MCGFLGQYSPQLSSKSDFLENLAIAKHRGPDQTGYWSNANIQLGFNRLSILDLTEAGHQPMQNNQGNWSIVFNGEIYNHKEIRKQIQGYSYKGHSDTETLVASLEQVGFKKTINRLIGMFAIAAYHIPSNQLYVARDSVGIKPFFYSTDVNNFWFASQFNQIIKGLGKQNIEILQGGMRDYLQFGFMQAPNTVYKNIKQLEPGQMAIVSANGITLKRFKEYPKHVQNSGLKDDSDEALQKFNELFSEVCKSQLQADVPLSTFLSGGIDSTIVNAYSKKFKPDLSAFTAGGDTYFDEVPIAEQYAKHLGIKHHTEGVGTDGIQNVINEHFDKMGEPFADYSSIPTYLICKKASENSIVMLGGDGGDELFWGYHRMHSFTQDYPFFKDSFNVRKIKKKLPLFKRPVRGAIYEFHRPDEMIENVHSHIFTNIVDDLMPGISKPNETSSLYHFDGKNQLEFRNWIRYNEFYGHMQRVLTKVDRMSMASSLEVRVPVLDQRVVDFAWNLESDFGLKKEELLKPFLKRALSQYIPDELINKKKMGFSVDLEKWLNGTLKEEVMDLLLSKDIYGIEHIDKSVWEKYVNDFYKNPVQGKSWGMWILYSWQKWGQSLDNL